MVAVAAIFVPLLNQHPGLVVVSCIPFSPHRATVPTFESKCKKHRRICLANHYVQRQFCDMDEEKYRREENDRLVTSPLVKETRPTFKP